MPRLLTHSIVLVLIAMVTTGCTRHDERLRQHREKLESLAASTNALGKAWLSGRTSGTYTRNALAHVFLLVEQERNSMTSRPDALVDPRGAQLSQSAERLERLLATLRHDVSVSDVQSVRRTLSSLSTLATEPR